MCVLSLALAYGRIENDQPVTFSAAALRLSGRHGTIVLDDMSDPLRWAMPKGTSARRITYPQPNGSSLPALQWTVHTSGGQAGAQFIALKLSRAFSCETYPELAFAWMLSSNAYVPRAVILRTASLHTPVDYHASELNLQPNLPRTIADTKGTYTYGALQYAGYFSFDSHFERRMVLVGSSGVLVVWDRMQAGQRLMGKQGGPCWHFGPTVPPRRATQ